HKEAQRELDQFAVWARLRCDKSGLNQQTTKPSHHPPNFSCLFVLFRGHRWRVRQTLTRFRHTVHGATATECLADTALRRAEASDGDKREPLLAEQFKDLWINSGSNGCSAADRNPSWHPIGSDNLQFGRFPETIAAYE